MNANFFDIHAAADYMGPGAIEVPLYQTEITDIVPAARHLRAAHQAGAGDRPSFALLRGDGNPQPAATRLRRSAQHRRPAGKPDPGGAQRTAEGLVSQINYNLFDIEVGTQQNQFAYLQAKDLADSVEGVLRTHDVALWNGNDTSLATPPRRSTTA